MYKVLALFTLLYGSVSLFAFEKLDTKYQIHMGDPDAPVKVVEYFSLSCPTCLEWFLSDFEGIQRDYLDTHRVSWTFHPVPADLRTLQLMVSLAEKRAEEKPQFLREEFERIAKSLQRESYDMEALVKNQAFQDAICFLKQEDVITLLPTLEIDGKIYDEIPTRKSLDLRIP